MDRRRHSIGWVVGAVGVVVAAAFVGSPAAFATPATLTLGNLPSNMTVAANEQGGAIVTYAPVGLANGVTDPNATVTCNPRSGTTFALGTTKTVSCTATDPATSPTSVSGSFSVTVTPGIPRTLFLHGTYSGALVPGTAVTFTAWAMDDYQNFVADVTPYTTFTGGDCTGNVCTAGPPGNQTITGTYGAITGTTVLEVGKIELPVTIQGAIVAKQHVLFNATATLPSGQLIVLRGASCVEVPNGEIADGPLISTALPYGTYMGEGCQADPIQSSLYAGDVRFGTVVSSAFGVTTATIPDGHLKAAYSAHLVAVGGSGYSWSVIAGALPPGVKLSTAGAFSGTPTATGTYAFTVQVTASPGHVATWSYSIAIGAAVTPLSITTSWLTPGTLGHSYSATIVGAGGTGTRHWTVVPRMPAGLKISSTGAISGVPTSQQGGVFSVTLTDSASPAVSVTRLFVFTVNPIVITPATLKAGKVKTYYSVTFRTVGGVAPFTWDFSGQLPPGMKLSSSGVLSGTPTTAGTYGFAPLVNDHGGNSAYEIVYLTINP